MPRFLVFFRSFLAFHKQSFAGFVFFWGFLAFYKQSSTDFVFF